MGEVTGISWTDSTFNPWIGCQRVSPGCEHCYAEALDKRVGGAVVDGTKQLRWGPNAPRVRTSDALWRNPIKWNRKAQAAGKRHRVFCASMADVFDDKVSDVWRVELFDLIRRTPALDWQLLTKRPEHIRWMLSAMTDAYVRAAAATIETADMLQAWVDGKPPANVWLGTTVEDQQRANERIPSLIAVPAVVHFLSCEPLLEPVDLSEWMDEDKLGFINSAIDWVIVGGESGPGARPFRLEWARSIIGQCRDGGRSIEPTPFVKQLGSNPHGEWGPGQPPTHHLTDITVQPPRESVELSRFKNGRWRLLDHHGANPAEWPADLRVQEFPEVRRA